MATDPKRFMALGLAPALAREIARAIDDAAGGGTPPTITVTLTGDVTGTGSGTTNIEVETTAGGG